MCRTLAVLCFLAGIAAAPLSIHAQGIEASQQDFVNAFLSVRKGEDHEKAGDLKAALATYRAAAGILTKIKQTDPNWQKDLVDFRLKRTMEAIDRIQSKMGGVATGTGANDVGVLPPLEVDKNPLEGEGPSNPAEVQPSPPKKTGKTKPASSTDDPFVMVKKRIEGLETQLADANDRLRDEQTKNAQLTKDMDDAIKARKKAEDSQKKAQNLAEVYQKSVLELKAQGDTNTGRVKELETKLAEAKKNSVDTQADLAAAEERISQLIDRSRALGKFAIEARTLRPEVKKLQERLEEAQKKSAETAQQARTREGELKDRIAELTKERSTSASLVAELKRLKELQASEQKAAAVEIAKSRKREEDLKGQLASITKERNDAREELTRLRDLNKQTDRLMTDNASLLKKLSEAEKQILTFKSEPGLRDARVAELRKQITETQNGLAASTEKNSTLEVEIGDLKKKIGDYSKQIAQFKTDKTASQEERQKMENENKLLQGIVMRVLQEDANRAQRKKMIQSEVSRLHIQSDVLLTQIKYLTEPVVKLSSAERRLFMKPVFEVQDPNTLVAIKNSGDGSKESPSGAPAKPETGSPTEKPAIELPLLPGEAGKTTQEGGTAATKPGTEPTKVVKLEKPEIGVKPKPGDDLPTKEPAEITSKETGAVPGVESMTGVKLPAEVKPIAEQAKQAFEREKFTDSEKLYDKALQVAPNNVYLISNRAVVQFRMGKYKQAEENFKKALSIAPEDAFCWATIGIVYYSEEKYDEAVNALTKSLAINPRNPTAHNYLGITAAQKGWLEAAQRELETSIQLDPKYADAWFNLAVSHTLKQPPNKDEARKAYAKAVELGADKDPAMEGMLK